jgi:acetyl esterase/lipase
VAVALGLVLVACSSGRADFYGDVPPNLAELAPGALIRSERVTDLAPSLEGRSVYRMMYRSNGALGTPVAVTGLVLVPDGSPPPGGWPVVAWGHGTSGVGDACAPSKYPNVYDGGSWEGYADLIADLVDEGYLVVATDYEGLGTPGAHTYLNADAEARAMVDGVVAARALVPDAGTEWAAVGHSQGGQAAIGAGELAGRAHGLTYVGAVAFAPAQHELEGVEAIASDPSNAPYLAYMAAGMRALDPGFGYARFLGPAYVRLMPDAERDCFVRWFREAAADVVPTPATVLNAAWASDPVVQRYFAATRSGLRPGRGPVLVLQGTADGLSLTYAAFLRTLCAAGTETDGRTYPGVSHTGVLVAGWPAARDWLRDRFADEPVPHTCAA